MIPAPRPANEAERLEALRRHRLYITGREPEFKRVARQVSDLFGVPIALVSLVLDDEQRFMGACGPDLPQVISVRVAADLFLPSPPAQAGHPSVGKRSASKRVGIIPIRDETDTLRR